MKRYLAFIVIAVLVISGYLIIRSQLTQKTQTSQTQQLTDTDIEASFKIMTDNINRSFINPKYHNKSVDVFITANDPTVIHVKKDGITWADFFNTLPMKLTKECLTTGDGETFCDGKDGTLKFYLNGVEDKDLLDREIKNEDSLVISFQ